MLDLTKIKVKYFQVKLPNGDVLHIKKPTQAMIKYVADMESLDMEEQLEKVYNFTVRVLNHNKEEKSYTLEDVHEILEFEVIQVLIEEYIKFVQDVAEKIKN